LVEKKVNIAMPKEKLLERGYCCGLGCQNCPYDPPHTEGVKKIKKSEKKA
jgi:hypothetical protein